MEGLRIKKPENTIEERIALQKKIQKELEAKQQKYAERREKLRLGMFENNNNNSNNNSNYNNNDLEEVNISRWTVIPANNENGGKFFEVPITPKAKKPLNMPPTLKRTHRTKPRFTNKNYEKNLMLPKIKRTRNTKKSKIGGRRTTQRKTYRRYK